MIIKSFLWTLIKFEEYLSDLCFIVFRSRIHGGQDIYCTKVFAQMSDMWFEPSHCQNLLFIIIIRELQVMN